MLKSQCDLVFNISKATFASNNEYRQIFTKLTDGIDILDKDRPADKDRPVNIEFSDIPKPERPISLNFYKNLQCREDLTAIYLLDDQNTAATKSKGHLLIGGVGEEITILSNLFYENFQFSKDLVPKRDMPSWNALDSYILPCTDIIIVDSFIFAEESLLDYNLLALLKVLSPKSSNSKINLVIFTAPDYAIQQSNGKYITVVPNWDSIRKKINNKFKPERIKVNITFVTYRDLEEHDRSIFTNYNNSHSGDSLNYYDSQGNVITKGRNYEIHSHGLKDHLDNSFLLLDDLQKVLNKLNDEKYKHCIKGDKKSNFLKFPS